MIHLVLITRVNVWNLKIVTIVLSLWSLLQMLIFFELSSNHYSYFTNSRKMNYNHTHFQTHILWGFYLDLKACLLGLLQSKCRYMTINQNNHNLIHCDQHAELQILHLSSLIKFYSWPLQKAGTQALLELLFLMFF